MRPRLENLYREVVTNVVPIINLQGVVVRIRFRLCIIDVGKTTIRCEKCRRLERIYKNILHITVPSCVASRGSSKGRDILDSGAHRHLIDVADSLQVVTDGSDITYRQHAFIQEFSLKT
jgi:hypothetical protein